MKRAATPKEINEAFEKARAQLGRQMTWSEIQALDASLAEHTDRDSMQVNHKLDTDTQVFFYEQDYYVLSNFSAFELRWKGLVFPTSEHAYHFEKFKGKEIRRDILYTRSAHEAFKLAEIHKAERRPDWDDVKLGIMREILFAKVDQHEYVRRKLLATGDRELVEDSWRDDFWGWGPKRNGHNVLGKLWMEVRASLRGESVTYLESISYGR